MVRSVDVCVLVTDSDGGWRLVGLLVVWLIDDDVGFIMIRCLSNAICMFR